MPRLGPCSAPSLTRSGQRIPPVCLGSCPRSYYCNSAGYNFEYFRQRNHKLCSTRYNIRVDMVRLPLFGLTAQTVLQASQKSFQPSSQSNSILRHEVDASFCPAGVRNHAGSIEISNKKELFYCMIQLCNKHHGPTNLGWKGLFESASEPANDPLIVWLSG